MSTALAQQSPIMALVQSPEVQKQIALALPRSLTKDRFIRMLLTTLRVNPKLCQCNQKSVLAGMFELAQMGLEPNTPLGHAWLIPYGSEAAVVIGYKGYIAMADRGGALLNAEVVYEGDDFDYQLGSDPRITHRPTFDIEKRGALKAAYSVATLADGRRSFKVVNRADVDEAKNRSQAWKKGKKDTPWFTDEAAMWRKTAIRRHAPYLPLATEFSRAYELDTQWEQGVAQNLQLPDAVPMADDPADLAREVESNSLTDEEKQAAYEAELRESRGETDADKPLFDDKPAKSGAAK